MNRKVIVSDEGDKLSQPVSTGDIVIIEGYEGPQSE